MTVTTVSDDHAAALRSSGIRVLKATLIMRWGHPRHARFTRKTRRQLRDKSISQLLATLFLREPIKRKLGGAPDFSRWLIRYYPDTGMLSVAPFRSNNYHDVVMINRTFGQLSPTQKLVKHHLSNSSIIVPGLPHQPDRSAAIRT